MKMRLTFILLVPLCLASLFVFRPEFWFQMGKAIAGGLVDELSFVWILHRLSENLLFDPGNLFDGKMMYPETQSLLFSETVFLSSLIYRAFFFLCGNRVLSYNLSLFTFLMLNYTAMFFFSRIFLGRLAASVSAAIFSFSLVRIAHLQHIHVMPQFWFPILGMCLYQYEAKKKQGYLYLAALCLALQFYFSMSLGMILLISLIPYGLISSLTKLGASRLRTLIPATALFGILVLPLANPYFKVSQKHVLVRSIQEAGVYSANIKSFFVVPKEHPYASWLVDGIFGGEEGQRQEKNLFVGFVALFLAIVGARTLWKTPSSAVWKPIIFFSLAFVVLFAMGRNVGLYNLFYHIFPGVKGIRTPARFGLSYLFLISILAGIGWQALQSRWKFPIKIPLLFLLTAFFAYENFLPIRFTQIPSRLASSTQFLVNTRDKAPTLFLPYEDKLDAVRMFESLEHNHPLANGYAGFRPRSFHKIHFLANQWMKEGKFENQKILRDYGFRYVVLEKPALREMGLTDWTTVAKSSARSVFEDPSVLVIDLGG